MSLLQKYLEDEEYRQVYVEEALVVDVTEAICEAMEDQGVSRAELARRMGVSRAAVTQALSGRNLSLRRIAAIADALGMGVTLALSPRKVEPSGSMVIPLSDWSARTGGCFPIRQQATWRTSDVAA